MWISRLYHSLEKMVKDSEGVTLTSARKFLFFIDSLTLTFDSKDNKRESIQLGKGRYNCFVEYFAMYSQSAQKTFRDNGPYQHNPAVVELREHISRYESDRVVVETLELDYKNTIALMKYIARAFAKKTEN